MWSSKLWIVIYLVTVVTEGYPGNDKMIHKNEVQIDLPHEIRTNVKDTKKNSIGLNSDDRQPTQFYKKVPAPMVDDDLLEFLVRIADNPAEWNKIRRVLSMLGREEKGTQSMAAANDHVSAAATTMTPSTTARRVMTPSTSTLTPLPPPTSKTTTETADGEYRGPPPPAKTTVESASSWPSGDWILKTVEKIRADARARGLEAGGEDGGSKDPYDYDDDDDDDNEIEEFDAPTTSVPAPPPPPPLPPRFAAGHMSRYQFKRIDGHPGDGRVNGTYVAVVESDRPPRDVVYEPVRQKNPKPAK